MAINSRAKGKRFELEVAHLFTDAGFPSRRGQQFSGANGDPDVVGPEDLHIEAKANEHLNLYAAMEQSTMDKRDGETPIVVHKKSRKPVLVTMYWEDWIEMYKRVKGELTHGTNRNNVQDRHGEA